MELFFQSDYCKIYTYQIDDLYVGVRIEVEVVGTNSNEATDREKIAFCITDTPSFDQIRKHKTTEDILYQLAKCKDFAVRIAKCFFVGKVNKPLERDLEEGLIDEFERDLILLHGEFYENIWKIISNKWKKLKSLMAKTFSDFYFDSELQLMEAIVHEHLTEPFINFTTAGYKEYSPHRHKTMWNLQLKSNRKGLTDKEEEKLKKITRERANNKGEINKWTARFLECCKILAEKDNYIETHLSIYKSITNGICAYNQKMHCNPSLSKHRNPSHAWVSGRVKWLNNS